jgi:hypothetical protein
MKIFDVPIAVARLDHSGRMRPAGMGQLTQDYDFWISIVT